MNEVFNVPQMFGISWVSILVESKRNTIATSCPSFIEEKNSLEMLSVHEQMKDKHKQNQKQNMKTMGKTHLDECWIHVNESYVPVINIHLCDKGTFNHTKVEVFCFRPFMKHLQHFECD